MKFPLIVTHSYNLFLIIAIFCQFGWRIPHHLYWVLMMVWYKNSQRLTGPAENKKSLRERDVLVLDLLTGRSSRGSHLQLSIFYCFCFPVRCTQHKEMQETARYNLKRRIWWYGDQEAIILYNLVNVESNSRKATFRIISLMPEDNKMPRKSLPKKTEKQGGFPEGEVRASLIVKLFINYFMQDRIINIISDVYLPYQNNNILCGSRQFYIINNTVIEVIPSQTLPRYILTCCCLQIFFEKQALNLHKKTFPFYSMGLLLVVFLNNILVFEQTFCSLNYESRMSRLHAPFCQITKLLCVSLFP